MAVSALSIFFLTTTTILITAAFTVFGILVGSYRRKRSTSAALLSLAFGLIATSELINGAAQWFGILESFSPELGEQVIGVLQALYINLFSLSFVFIFAFSARYLLKIGEVMKLVLNIALVITSYIITTLMFVIVMGGSVEVTSPAERYLLAGTGIIQYNPTIVFGLVVYIPIAAILLWIIYRLHFSQQHTKDLVQKRGIRYILFSFSSILITIIGNTFFFIEPFTKIIFLVFLGQLLRVVGTTLTLIFGYLGWVLPSWLRRRIRSEAWIAKKAEKILSGQLPLTTDYISSEGKKDFISSKKTQAIREVSEP